MVREIGYSWIAIWVFAAGGILFMLSVNKDWELFTGKIYINRVRLTVFLILMFVVILNFYNTFIELYGKTIYSG